MLTLFLCSPTNTLNLITGDKFDFAVINPPKENCSAWKNVTKLLFGDVFHTSEV
jgi:hypothetical protein